MTEPTHRDSLHAYFAYRDAPKALRWLEQAFGFETTMEFPDDDGGIMHAELRRDDAAILVFTADRDFDRPAVKGDTLGHGTYVCVASSAAVDEVFETAVAANATVIWPPDTTPWGQYRCRVVDLEGYEWTFGTLRPGLDQAYGEA